MKKIISLMIVVAVLCTSCVSLSVLATESHDSGSFSDEVPHEENPSTGDCLFICSVVAAVVSLCVLYLIMRRKYIK